MNGINIPFSVKQKKEVEKYRVSHNCKQFQVGAGGFGSTSKIAFKVSYNSIGCCIRLFCPYCGVEVDITDTDTW